MKMQIKEESEILNQDIADLMTEDDQMIDASDKMNFNKGQNKS